MADIFDLTEGSIIKKLWVLALPVLLTTISQMAYSLTDMFWIGKVNLIGLVEMEAISAIGTAGYITWFAFGIILITEIGTSVKVSHAVGEKDYQKINLFASNGLLQQIFIGFLVSLVILLFRGQIISIFNINNPQVITYANQYLAIVGGLIFFQFIISGFASINSGLGKTKTNFKIMVIGLIVNIILDPILIIVFKWGVIGAAIATVFAQATTMFVFFLHHITKKEKLYHVKLNQLDKKTIATISKIGLPAGLQSMFFTVISIFIARMVFRFGENVMAAQRVGSQVEQLTWMISGGFQTALTVFVGQNYGARQYQRIKKSFRLISALLIPYALIVALFLFFFAKEVMGIFITDVATKTYGIKYLKIISLSQVFMMMTAIGAGVFNGCGRTYISSISTIIGNGLRIPFALFLVKKMSEEGIWWALNLSDIFKGLFLFVAAFYLVMHIEKFKHRELQKVF